MFCTTQPKHKYLLSRVLYLLNVATFTSISSIKLFYVCNSIYLLHRTTFLFFWRHMSILFQERRPRTIIFYDIGAIIVTRSCYSNKNEIFCITPICESINFKLQLFVVGTLSTKTISLQTNLDRRRMKWWKTLLDMCQKV